jgi:hypothetical protein
MGLRFLIAFTINRKRYGGCGLSKRAGAGLEWRE